MIDPLLRKRERPIVLHEAEFAEDVSAVSDPARVIIPSFDRTFVYGPCPWPSRNNASGLVLPVKGDRALVAFSDNNEPWVVMWWPY